MRRFGYSNLREAAHEKPEMAAPLQVGKSVSIQFGRGTISNSFASGIVMYAICRFGSTAMPVTGAGVFTCISTVCACRSATINPVGVALTEIQPSFTTNEGFAV